MRGYHHLTRAQRYVIEELLGIGKCYADIARELGVHRSTVSREIRRNSGRHAGITRYVARGAHLSAQINRLHPICYENRRKIVSELECAVRQKLIEGWSPQQISVRLKDEWDERISFQSIYNYVHRQMLLGDEIHHCLRRFGKRRRRYGVRRKRGLKRAPEDRKRLDLRPEEAELRLRTGHWERDLIEGKRGKAALLTLVDRHSRLTLIRKVERKTAEIVDQTTYAAFRKGARLKCRTLSNDNGMEFSRFQELQRKLKASIYFAQPYQAWQRGSVENANGLIRQYFRKGTDISEIPEQDIRECETQLNQRPRRILGYRTPEEVHFKKKLRLIPTKRMYQRFLARQKDESHSHLTVAPGG